MQKRSIYCAGPLFNSKERDDMREIADALEEADYSVFLPQRDGLEFAHYFPQLSNLTNSDNVAATLLKRAIFYLDVYHILKSDGLVLNINGRVPDEGAVAEAGIAWSSGKEIVIFKDDVRSLVDGSDNPLVVGLSDFAVTEFKKDIPLIFDELFSNKPSNSNSINNSKLHQAIDIGSKLQNKINSKHQTREEICRIIIKILGGNGNVVYFKGKGRF